VIEPGDLVTAEQMKHLFGTGAHPITGEALESPYRVYGNDGVDGFNVEVKRRVDAADRPPNDAVARIRSEVAREWFVRQHDRKPTSERELSAALARYSRPRQTAVAGYDLTFSPVKSVSALWAVGPPKGCAAHPAGPRRSGCQCAGVRRARGAVHPRRRRRRPAGGDARGDRDSVAAPRLPGRRPDLHTHMAVANKGQTKEGKWLSIYGRVVHQHVVAASETYNTSL